ncbi:MAG: ribonuclease HII [Oscillospiraceae bacterium]|jgi:ribonuclease HII|nr:ribonuclease HII [Oscillospiraceae bacterium]
MDLLSITNDYIKQGYKLICGVDEAGRGPLAGPVYAAAVILPIDLQIPGLNDSKKLSSSKRDELYDMIIKTAVSYSIESASNDEIDSLNILNATFLAMNRAINALSIKPDKILIDGNLNKGINTVSEYIIRGDSKVESIAAASILAKVSRDRYMLELDSIYPQYGFAKHKGYGTKLHYEKLREFGISNAHRKTFLRKII